jgi:hypothetical protein
MAIGEKERGGEGMDTDTALAERQTALFNQGVRTGDWGPMLAHFTDDAELYFTGIPVGPFHGKAAIAAAYAAAPPDDEIVPLAISADGDTVSVVYAWQRAPGERAGVMVLTPRGDQIARLLIVYER